MRFILRKRTEDRYDSWYDIIDEETKNPPLAEAELEAYDITVIRHPQITIEYKNEALLNDEGKPYIHSWNEVVYDPSWEEWCKVGTNHIQKETSSAYHSFKNYEFTRNEIRYRWTIEITDINLLENLLKCGWSIDKSWQNDEEFYLDFEA